MAIGVAEKFTKQSGESKPWVYSMQRAFAERSDAPQSVELVVSNGITATATIDGLDLHLNVDGGVDQGVYDITARVHTTTGRLEEFDFVVKVKDTPSQFNDAADAAAARTFSDQSKDAQEGSEIAAAASLTHAVEAAERRLDAFQAADEADQSAQQAEQFAAQAYEAAAVGAAAAVDALYVDSVAALRALPAPAKKCVVTLGSYNGGGVFAGDGGGQLLWVPASTRPDNGITVFTPNSAPANGRWERGGVPVPEWGGAVGDGVTDDTAGVTRWLGLGGSLALTGGKSYRVTGQCTGVAGAEIDGRGAQVLVDMPQSSTAGAWSWAGTGDLGSQTTATADLVKGLQSLPVADATGYGPGDQIWIISTEYFNGITGFSGYTPKTKGEMSTVRSVSGNTITLDEPLKDNYTLAGNTITVSRRGLAKSVRLKGIKFRNRYGWGGTHTTANPTGARALKMTDVQSVHVEACEFSNFPRFGAEIVTCRHISFVGGNHFTGYDLTDATNLPKTSVWFTGVNFMSCENVAFVGNHAINSRRHFDADSFVGRPVCRNITITANTAENCENTVGTHCCDDVTISANIGNGCGGINFRGKNATITGNIIRLDGTKDTRTGISCGHTSGSSVGYTENTSLGDLLIAYNQISGAHNCGIRITADVDSLDISHNTVRDSSDCSIAVIGKRTRNVDISHNKLWRDLSGDPKVGIHFPNYATIPREVLDDVGISHNRLYGAGSYGIVISGGPISAPADNIDVNHNRLSGHTQAHISLAAPTSGELAGYYGRNVAANENTFLAPTPSNGDIHIGSAARIQPRIGNNYWSSNAGYCVLTSASISGLTGRTWEPGMRVRYPTPGAGGWSDRVCVTGGTSGTLSGVTGSIASGSNQLTVSDVAGLPPGTYLTVTGAGLPTGTRVLSVSGNVVALSANATATVAGAAVAYTASSFKDYAAVAA